VAEVDSTGEHALIRLWLHGAHGVSVATVDSSSVDRRPGSSPHKVLRWPGVRGLAERVWCRAQGRKALSATSTSESASTGKQLRDAAGHAVCHEAVLRPFTDVDSMQHIGGRPNRLQGDEAPNGWTFLLQLDSTQLCDTAVNFGDSGIGYAFISPDRREGRFLWQSG
jgi:hypothetical protein